MEYDKNWMKKPVYSTDMVFELRENNENIRSTLMKQYKINDTRVNPEYFENPTSNSGYDLVLWWIAEVPAAESSVDEVRTSFSYSHT